MLRSIATKCLFFCVLKPLRLLLRRRKIRRKKKKNNKNTNVERGNNFRTFILPIDEYRAYADNNNLVVSIRCIVHTRSRMKKKKWFCHHLHRHTVLILITIIESKNTVLNFLNGCITMPSICFMHAHCPALYAYMCAVSASNSTPNSLKFSQQQNNMPLKPMQNSNGKRVHETNTSQWNRMDSCSFLLYGLVFFGIHFSPHMRPSYGGPQNFTCKTKIHTPKIYFNLTVATAIDESNATTLWTVPSLW